MIVCKKEVNCGLFLPKLLVTERAPTHSTTLITSGQNWPAPDSPRLSKTYLIGANFSESKTGRCASTNESYREYSLGTELSTKRGLRLTLIWAGIVCESDIRSLKGHGQNIENSILHDCQHKTVEAYLCGRDLFIAAQPELEKVWL